jgi:hypothetical protein
VVEKYRHATTTVLIELLISSGLAVCLGVARAPLRDLQEKDRLHQRQKISAQAGRTLFSQLRELWILVVTPYLVHVLLISLSSG